MEVAFAPAFDHGNDVIGVPEAFACAGAQTPLEQSFQPRHAAQPPELAFGMEAIDAASGAYAAIAFENFFTKVAGIAAQAPLLHAPLRTEGHAAFGDFEIAPAAKIPAVGASRKTATVHPASLHRSLGTHRDRYALRTPITRRALQKIAKREHDCPRRHLTVQWALGDGCSLGCDSVYSASARTLFFNRVVPGWKATSREALARELRTSGRRGVSVQSSKFLLALALTGMLGPASARMFGQATAPSSAKPQKNWKDRMEYDLYVSITKDTNPKTRLDKLEQWQKVYPKTDWEAERKTLFLTTYAALNQPKDAVDEASKILADNPKDFTALYYTMYFTQALYAQTKSADALDGGEKAAKAIVENIDTPPPGVSADQWAKLRPQVELLAHTNLGWIAMQRMNWAGAQAEFQKSLMLNPNDAQVDYWMGTVVASEKKVETIPVALFYFARAATYQGPGALPAAAQQAAMTYVQKQYKNFHGSDDGFNDLVAAAKTNPNPPAGFTIKNANEIAQQQFQSDEDWKKAHPAEALWGELKMTLTGPSGDMYFTTNMKGAELPTLKGRVISLEPANRPKTIMLAMEDKANNTTTPDATLKFEMPLPGKVEPGTELTFEGVPDSYTGSPFMVVFNVEKDKLHGWTGKNEPAPRRHHTTAEK